MECALVCVQSQVNAYTSDEEHSSEKIAMQRVNEFSFYELAEKIHPMTELPSSAKLSLIWLDLWNARSAVNTIFSVRPLNVCAAAAGKLQDAITTVVPDKWEDLSARLSEEGEDAVIHPWKLTAIQQAAKEFETVLAAECQVLDTYFVSKKGFYILLRPRRIEVSQFAKGYSQRRFYPSFLINML